MSEQLTSFVSEGSSISTHSLIRNVGQGSIRQDFLGEVLIIFINIFFENLNKGSNFWRIRRRMNFICSARGSKSVLIFLILLKKWKQTSQPMTFQTREMGVLHQRPCSEFYAVLAIVFSS